MSQVMSETEQEQRCNLAQGDSCLADSQERRGRMELLASSNLPKLGWIGIDLQSDVIRFAQLLNSRGSLSARTATIRIPERTGVESARSDWLEEHVARVVQEAGWTGLEAACVLPRLGYQEGTVEISGSDPSELDRQLHELVQRRLAVGDQQITLDWWEHPFEVPTVMEGQRRINYVALRNEFASRSLKSLQRAGLSVVCVDSPGFVAARLLQMQGIPSSDHTALVLEITHQATRLTCVYRDLPVYSRTLSSLGWDAACAEVAKQYRITSREAIVLLNRYGRSSRELNGDQLLIRTLLQDAAGDYRRMLTHELYRTISYLDQKLRLPSVATCLMVGEHARQVFARDAVSELVPVETTLHEIRQADQVETMLSSEEWGNALSLSWLGYEARPA